MIKIDDWVIEKGEKAQGKIEITGCGMAMPATVICGVEDGPTILITAGVHSAEYVGIQAAMELAKEFQPEELKGNVIIIPLQSTLIPYHKADTSIAPAVKKRLEI